MGDEHGLSTTEALDKLYNDIENVLKQFNVSEKTRKWNSWLRESLHHNSLYTTINWVSTLILVLIAVLFLCCNDTILLIQAILIIILLVGNIFIELLDNKLRHSEVSRRIKGILGKLKNEMGKIVWKSDNYPNLLLPFSPCITLQWTYRDGHLVNLPWALLVKDDIILVRPGQISPGYCEALDKNAEYCLLHAKEVYGPSLQNANEVFSTPKYRRPLENKKYRLLETPYLNNLRIALEQALDRPVTVQNQQRHFIMIKIIERILVPIILILVLIVNGFKYIFIECFNESSSWVNLLVLTPIATVLPLLPLAFGLAWNLLNYYGIARFKHIFDITLELKLKDDFGEHENGEINSFNFVCDYKSIWNNFLNVLKGKEDMLVRSANILHVLGSLTALCCVDKKGILSWPNPTAEKVFFLHNTDTLSQASSLANLGDLSTDADSLHATSDSIHNNENFLTTVPEVLDLTHDQNHPFKLHFDDTSWQKHLNSLKPLGLAILLNTCNINTQECYTKFCSHITCEAMYNENLIPVTNRRCLCELAKEIGFLDQAQKIFALEQQLSSFRHLQNETARRDNKFARSLHLATKLKFQFPHMFAVVVKELSSGSMQLLSQGTADMVLDSCIDYWDGHDLCPLTSSDRKKIQDFYQRCSLTAYCTAFAYRPLHKRVSEKLSKMYLELPSDSQNLYLSRHSPTSMHCDCRTVLEPRIKPSLGQFYSTDSLLYNDSPGSDASDVESCFDLQCNQVFIGMVTMQYQVLHDMVQLIEQLERACIRFVHFSKENELRSRVFSEKMGLESGWNCHISLLSERSRRESGPSECWANNGTIRVSSPADMPRHIRYTNRKMCSPTSEGRPFLEVDSTLDSTKALSYSAPSAINVEQSVVKFDIEHEPLTMHIYENEDTENQDGSQTSQLQGADANSTTHEWQSLSCLTDSTEQSAPINFDLSNRAKLPRGIDKIRPHIENIDNVPLLVSLFTDCTPSNTKEMIRIMQDYGEVICVIGSSANYDSVGVFMQADASIAVEPLYPQVCQKVQPCVPVTNESISPIDLSRWLNSIACSLSIKREDPLSIIYLIIESRHYMALLWNTGNDKFLRNQNLLNVVLVQFWLCSSIALSAMQLITTLLMLPNLLTTGQVLWISVLIIPILSTSLMGTIVDKEVMKKPQGKKQVTLNYEVAIFILWCYGAKFLPMTLFVVASYAGSLAGFCNEICEMRKCSCKYFYLPMNQLNSTNEWIDYTSNVTTAQSFCVILILLHLGVISICFVHRHYSIWNKGPHHNIFWVAALIFLFILQLFFSYISLRNAESDHENYLGFQGIPTYVVIVGFLSPIITFAINEIIKREEIKADLRHQRRVRLDFGTKLGMNSPF
ncbi:hypothetical protein RN001_013845 [Aquatica leii]|uniref:Cation-transporting P-type ATPase C-terminal domain-containing protein n=1 Tax=Aquatica leii TaxID=1421715 RepID=A0AAN7SNW3_9COLE|nr:hypothetical protein RN001_013845 [Aquatica leii]